MRGWAGSGGGRRGLGCGTGMLMRRRGGRGLLLLGRGRGRVAGELCVVQGSSLGSSSLGGLCRSLCLGLALLGELALPGALLAYLGELAGAEPGLVLGETQAVEAGQLARRRIPGPSSASGTCQYVTLLLSR